MTDKRKAKNSKVSREILNCTCKVWEVHRTVNFKKKIKNKRLIHYALVFWFIIQSINFNLVKLKIPFRLQFQDIDLRPQ